jgi:starch phosphorylase
MRWLDECGWQFEDDDPWNVAQHLKLLEAQISITVDRREVWLQCWEYEIRAISGGAIPVYFLDADLERNSEWGRRLTDRLYLGDDYLRICQEVVLGPGGVRMLRALGHEHLERIHMNEENSAFLGLELLHEEMRHRDVKEINEEVLHAVRRQCVFTTHTPVPAGHDQFPLDQVKQVLGHHAAFFRRPDLFGTEKSDGQCLNMAYLALHLSATSTAWQNVMQRSLG